MRVGGIVLVALFAAAELGAQQREIALLAGWQSGGELTAGDSPEAVRGAASFGAMLSFRRSPETMLDFVFLHQSSTIEGGDFFEPVEHDVTTDYLHVGGRYRFAPQQRVDPYIAATIGAGRVALDGDDIVAFSFALGGGADLTLTRHVAFRLDGRYYVTLADAATVIACRNDGECTTLTTGSSYNQLAGAAGVVFRW